MARAHPRSHHRRVGPVSFVAGLLLIAASAVSPVSGATLQEQLDAAVSAFAERNYAAAYWQFENMELDFGEEPEFTDNVFQASVLPVRAYAALMADRPTDALVYFNRLLREFNPGRGLRAFVLYNSAIAQAQAGALAAAANTFQAFQQAFPGSAEAELALLQEAELRHTIGATATAAGILDDFYASNASDALRMQARLRALQIAGEAADAERVRKILFDTDWNTSAMPDIAILSFAALEAGDLLLEQGLPEDAVRAYRLTLPHRVLIAKQREQLRSAERALAEQSAFASSIWLGHAQQQIARLRQQLERLETMENYTPGLYIRSGQAYLLAGRYREAIILFRSVAEDTLRAPSLRAEAHYRWILALTEAEKWAEARGTAHAFLKEHPEHSLISGALFLIARAYQGEGLFAEAIEVVDELIASFPDHKQAPRWYFTRGHNYCLLEQHAEARNSFEEALERFPKSRMAVQLELWRGLTYFFDRDYATSLNLLVALREENQTHPLYPEIIYRIANIHYAQRSYAVALETAGGLIEAFPDHHRVPETQALRGDIYMGLGELTRAAQAFRQVPAEDARLYDYAIFQAAKIYKALERYDLLRDHLNTYIARKDAHERPRVSEALYWIGWSLQAEDRASEAFPVFENALNRFGNDPDARAVASILAAYADLYKRHGAESTPSSPDFEHWLRKAAEQSLEAGELTWFARITLFATERQRTRSGDDAAADAALLSIHRFVPIDQQDPASLAAVGVALARRGYRSGEDYFERILTEYPKRPERAAAYYGKASLAAAEGQLDIARRWLIRFLEETPTHPLAADARLLAGDVLMRQGQYAAARDTLNEILGIKGMRGRPHARALAGLARIEMAQANPKRAIPYWQRIYTLYRAYPEIIIDAYWESALLFETIGDATAARNTVRELLEDERLKGFDQYGLAEAKLPELEAAARAEREIAAHADPASEAEVHQ